MGCKLRINMMLEEDGLGVDKLERRGQKFTLTVQPNVCPLIHSSPGRVFPILRTLFLQNNH